MRKSVPGEYTAGRGTPARTHTGESKKLSVGESARVERILSQETGPHPYETETLTEAQKRAAELTNQYSEEGPFSEEV